MRRLVNFAIAGSAVALALAVPLAAGAAASGSGVSPTTGAISGEVRDANGPLSGICVLPYQDESADPMHQGISDGSGAYLLQNLAPGDYTILYESCSDGGADVQPQFYAGTQDSASAETVTVKAGQTLTLGDVTMQAGGDIVLTLSYPDGSPIVGLHVETKPAYPSFAPDVESYVIHWDATDVEGQVSIRDLLPIPYHLIYASCPTFSCGEVGHYKGQPWNSYSWNPVTPTPGTAEVLSDELQPATAVTSQTVLTAAPNPSSGDAVTLQASVSDDDGPIVDGPVDFFTSTTDFGWAWTNSDGIATLTTSAIPEGTTDVYASYYGRGPVAPSEGDVEVTVDVSGGEAAGGGVPVTATVAAGNSLSSDPAGAAPDATNPLVVGVTSPVSGAVSIDKAPPNTPMSGYRVLDVGATITAPQATAAQPLTLSFQVFDGHLPAGSYPSDLTVFRDGAAIAPCTTPGVADPDPCMSSTATQNGVTTISILSSHASTWDVEAADVGRIGGADRLATAVAVSRNSFPDGKAGAVVLARADDYPDALVGTPLAAAKDAPLLLTQGTALPQSTADEIARVLPAGETVYLLGGTAAIPESVASELEASGYQVVRYGGKDRFATALAVADVLGDPDTVLLATGTNFPDALAAGPAAAHIGGAVLLTNGSTLPAAVASYLDAHATTTYAIGGPAAAADPTATPISGADRYATAAAVAAKFFPTAKTAGVATAMAFPDALSGGAQLARAGAPLLLSSRDTVGASTTSYLSGVSGGLETLHLYGGTAALADSVATQLRASIDSG